ncbi:MAG TPA: hypothetical protein VIG74_02015 [Alphaproteobacteria bacterium]|jgi:hypothetical protein
MRTLGHNVYRPQRLISYVVASDDGLAPNVSGGICTLAVCKPVIRQVSKIGQDWILGISTSTHGRNRLVYAMQVDEKIPYADYFTDPRFANKKPGIDRQGDNFFCFRRGHYKIAFNNAAHFGKPEKIARDLKVPLTVVSHHFWYFGGNAPELPADISRTNIVVPGKSRRGHRLNSGPSVIASFMKWIEQYPPGIHGRARDIAAPLTP